LRSDASRARRYVVGVDARRNRLGFDGVKVFSASRDRVRLGQVATEWLQAADVVIVDAVVTQSSDRQFHCLSITIFFRTRA